MGINRHPPPVQHRGVMCHTVVGNLRWWRRGCTQGGCYSCGSWEVQQQPKSYDGSMVVGKECGGRLTQPTPAQRVLRHTIVGNL